MLAAISEICTRHELKVANIFHAGDGNLHPLILYNANDPDEALRAEQAGAEILIKCVELGGCLTGEHGVGIEKRDLMRVQFNEVDLGLQMRIKTAIRSAVAAEPGQGVSAGRAAGSCGGAGQSRLKRLRSAPVTAASCSSSRGIAYRLRQGSEMLLNAGHATILRKGCGADADGSECGRRRVEVVGGGTKRDIGRPTNVTHTMSLRMMRGVTLYEPNEMVMSVRAGTPVSEVVAQLAKNRQMLAFEPSEFAGVLGTANSTATIGACLPRMPRGRAGWRRVLRAIT